jgi:hypothetical protein
MDLQAFLLWLGSAVGSGAVASFVLERLAWFQSLATESKKWVSFAFMAGVGVVSFLVLNYVPAEMLSLLAPYFAILASAFASVFSGQAFHKTDKKDGVG